MCYPAVAIDGASDGAGSHAAVQRGWRKAAAGASRGSDTWTWTALDEDSKLILSWVVGGRGGGYALAFMDDLRCLLANHVQLTTDGHRAYLEAVDDLVT